MNRTLAILLAASFVLSLAPMADATAESIVDTSAACGPGDAKEFVDCMVQSTATEARYLVCKLWKDEPKPIFC